MDIRELQRRAVVINHLYDRHNAAAGRAPWSGPDLAMGFVGDVGDLVKLVMAVEDRRSIDDARARLGARVGGLPVGGARSRGPL